MVGCRTAMLRLGNIGLSLSTSRTLIGSLTRLRIESVRSRGLGFGSGYARKTTSSGCASLSANRLGAVSPVPAGQGEEIELLDSVDDDHGGVLVEMEVPMSSGKFVSCLRASMLGWKQQGKRGVWLKLPIALANLVQPAVEEGFKYHHAEPSYLMLVYWIPATKNTLPINATHRVGVGAFVMNDKGEVLAVQERSGKLRGSGLWKFPTGVVDQGEDIFAGAIREVKEETGIDTEFLEVLAFRQSHMSFFEKSDLFFVCMLRPLSFDILKQESEIEAAQWMPIKEFAAQPSAQKHELLKHIIDAGWARAQKLYTGLSPVCIKSAFTDRQSYLYLNDRGLNPQSCNDSEKS
ncbi:nudix hydrolase 10-like isoform X1 [Iris pallida]|uniref:Nudix hydrolase 10-like isoform X1 n=1 Tax=Iris pallida TaxID=29817 RepID=A0AAX6FEA9_IRIPA|nr:nudix hydrolase 10-like isoform X1 [Iris pallida]